MKSFEAAVEQELSDDDVLEFSVGGQTFRAMRPNPGQSTLVLASFNMGPQRAITAIYRFLEGILLDDGYDRITEMIGDGTITFDLLFGGDDKNDQGIIEWIIEEVGARPTQPLSGSSASSNSSGKRSTGRSPGKGSTRSD